MKAPFRIIVITSILAAVFFVLVSAQSGHASFRRFHTFSSAGDGYTGRTCVDGFSVGFIYSSSSSTGTRTVDVLTYPTGTPVITQVLSTNWITVAAQTAGSTRPYTTSEPNPFCALVPYPGKETYCTGLHYVRFPHELPVGTEFTIGFYGPNQSEIRRSPQDTIEDCRLGTTRVQSVGGIPSGATTTVTDSVEFEVFAADPDIPTSRQDSDNADNGAGIIAVNLSAVDSLGREVFNRTDQAPPYCLFGETDGGSCLKWFFAQHDYTWPNGLPLTSGTFRLRAAVDSYFSSDQVIEWPIDVQYWQVHTYLPYVDANSSWPVTAQQ